jgi:quercetin dioxygenase-like cupin family protein
MHTKRLLILPLILGAGLAIAQVPAVQPILPESLRWTSPPNLPGLKGAWVLGSEKAHGTYVQRVELASGTRIAPHTHPDTRNSTVLSGTLYVAFGERPADADFVAIPTGAVYVAPANQPHTLWARDGKVVYQEAGTGPTGTNMLR